MRRKDQVLRRDKDRGLLTVNKVLKLHYLANLANENYMNSAIDKVADLFTHIYISQNAENIVALNAVSRKIIKCMDMDLKPLSEETLTEILP